MPDPISLSSLQQDASQFAAPGLGIAGGIAAGGTRGDIQAAASAAKLGTNLASAGYFGQGAKAFAQDAAPYLKGFSQFAQGASELANIYTGIQSGTPLGYTSAAVNAAELGMQTGLITGTAATVAGEYLPGIGDALALYQFGRSWVSGDTGGDALRGAQAGATIGTSIMPGVGTVVGAAIGAAAGAVSSAFGGGRADPETMALNNYAPQFNKDPRIGSMLNPAQNFQLLSGIMDAKNNTPGHSTPQEQHYGRMGEAAMMTDVFTQVNAALKSGKISATSSAQQIYQQVVDPYFKSKGMGITAGWPYETSHGANFGNAMQAAITNMIGQWQSGKITSSTPLGIAGQTVNVPAWGGGANLSQQQTQAFQNYGSGIVQQLIAQMPVARVARH